MIFKLVVGVFAAALAMAFYAVPIIKLKDPALITVVLLGVIPMFIDLIDKLRHRGDDDT